MSGSKHCPKHAKLKTGTLPPPGGSTLMGQMPNSVLKQASRLPKRHNLSVLVPRLKV